CSSVFLLHTHSRLVLLPFFFSSRRRHTRSKRDWSSDVCSSDLTPPCAGRASKRGCVSLGSMSPATVPEWSAKCIRQLLCGAGLRSEERRVGKECRWRWSEWEEKKGRREEERDEARTSRSEKTNW